MELKIVVNEYITDGDSAAVVLFFPGRHGFTLPEFSSKSTAQLCARMIGQAYAADGWTIEYDIE